MHIIRTISWVLFSVFIAVFVVVNYGEPQRVKVWISDDPIGFDWPVGIIALVFWLLGVIPAWLYHRGVKWSMSRRIRSLEASIKSNALAQRHQPDASRSPAAAVAKPVGGAAEASDNLSPGDSSTTA